MEFYNNGDTISGGLIRLLLIPNPPLTGHVKDVTMTWLLYVTACSVDKRNQHFILIFGANFYYLNEKKASISNNIFFWTMLSFDLKSFIQYEASNNYVKLG